MSQKCECGRRVVVKSVASHARPGFIARKGHDLCGRCWRSLSDSIQLRRSWVRISTRPPVWRLELYKRAEAKETSLLLMRWGIPTHMQPRIERQSRSH